MPDHRNTAGFTLVELLVAVALMGLVTVALMQTFTVQHRTYTVVEQVTETQQTGRAIASLLEAEVRAAGFMVPEANAFCAADNLNGPDVLHVSSADLLDPTGLGGPDVSVGLINGNGWRIGDGGGTTTITLDSAAIPDGDGATPFFDLDADGTPDSDFAEGMGVIVSNAENAGEGTACGRIVAPPTLTAGQAQLQVQWDELMQDPVGGTDYRFVPAHAYTVNGTNLLRDGTPMATEVEDLQVSAFYDLDGDGQPAGLNPPATGPEGDGSEWPGSGVGAVQPPLEPGSGLWPANALRQIRVSFVVRTRAEDPNRAFDGGAVQTIENRAAVAGNDGFRRRIHTTMLRARNVGFRDLQ